MATVEETPFNHLITPGTNEVTPIGIQVEQLKDANDDLDAIQVEFDEVVTLWDNFEAHVF